MTSQESTDKMAGHNQIPHSDPLKRLFPALGDQSNNDEHESLKSDHDSQRKAKIKNGDIENSVNELTDETQEWCSKNTQKLYYE